MQHGGPGARGEWANDDGNVCSGSIVYQLFQEVVHYAPYYRGVRSVSALGNEAVGFIDVPRDFPTFLDKATICHPIDVDNLLQVTGTHVNCLSSRRDDEVFMCTAVDEVVSSPCLPRPAGASGRSIPITKQLAMRV